MGDVSLSIQSGKGSHEQPLLRETLSVISFWCQGTPSYVITGVPFCPPVEPGGYHSLGRGQAACLCRGGGGTAMAVAEGRGLLAVSHGEVSALEHSITAAWGVEASLTQLQHSTATLFCMQLPWG